MHNSTALRELDKRLSGSTGVVYLMFLERETYTASIQEPLLKAHVFKNKENVNQAFKRLEKKEGFFLQFVRAEQTPGNPRYYKANFAPVFTTLKELDIEFDENRLRASVERLSFLNEVFPQHLNKIESIEGKIDFTITRIPWIRVLSAYFSFLAASLLTRKIGDKMLGSVCELFQIPKSMKSLVRGFLSYSSVQLDLNRQKQIVKAFEQEPDPALAKLISALELEKISISLLYAPITSETKKALSHFFPLKKFWKSLDLSKLENMYYREKKT